MKRRQAIKCVRRHYCIPMTWYAPYTWRQVQRTLRRHQLAYWEKFDMRDDGLWHYTQGVARTTGSLGAQAPCDRGDREAAI